MKPHVLDPPAGRIRLEIALEHTERMPLRVEPPGVRSTEVASTVTVLDEQYVSFLVQPDKTDGTDAQDPESLLVMVKPRIIAPDPAGLDEVGTPSTELSARARQYANAQTVALSEQLARLEVELAQARLIKTERHPDIVRLKRQIEAVNERIDAVRTTLKTDPLSLARRQYVDSDPVIHALREEIAKLEVELSEARQTKADGHPELVRIRNHIAALEARISEIRKESEQQFDETQTRQLETEAHRHLLNYIAPEAAKGRLPLELRRYVQTDGDPRSHYVTVTAPSALADRIVADLKQMDVRPESVLLDLRVLTVDRDAFVRLGLDWTTRPAPENIRMAYADDQAATDALLTVMRRLGDSGQADVMSHGKMCALEGWPSQIRGGVEHWPAWDTPLALQSRDDSKGVDSMTALTITVDVDDRESITLSTSVELAHSLPRDGAAPVVSQRTVQLTGKIQDGGTVAMAGPSSQVEKEVVILVTACIARAENRLPSDGSQPVRSAPPISQAVVEDRVPDGNRSDKQATQAAQSSGERPQTEWSAPVNGLRARVVLARSHVFNGTPIISTRLDLQNVTRPERALPVPAGRKLTFRVVGADGHELPRAQSVYDGMIPIPKGLSLAPGGALSEELTRSGLGVGPDQLALIDLGAEDCWVIPRDERPYFLHVTLEMRETTAEAWHGRLALPPARIPLQPEPMDPDVLGSRIEKLGRAMIANPHNIASERAERALSLIYDEPVVPWYVAAVRTNSYKLKFAALDRLSRFDGDEALAGLKIGMATRGADIGNCTTPEVATRLADGIRHATAIALARSPHRQAKALLWSMWNDPAPAVRITVMQTATRMNTKEAHALLERMTADPDEQVRNEAIRLLADTPASATPDAQSQVHTDLSVIDRS
ncbi:MAG: HEAT repeat domain-containing protein [Sedimentisphaerales bacterium]|nr:HEAT repeat domain-containing protein [Sedimentisphaerales bacterium]